MKQWYKLFFLDKSFYIAQDGLEFMAILLPHPPSRTTVFNDTV